MDELRKILPTADSGYLLVGTSDSNLSSSKSQTSRGGVITGWGGALGEKLWDRRFGGSGERYLQWSNCYF